MAGPANSAARSSNLRGAAIMLVAVGSFALMDASLKTLSPHYSAMQVTTLRALSALPLVLVWVGVRGGFGQLLRIRFGLPLFRAVLGIISLATFTYGLRHLPLSEAYSIFFVAPLLITIFAALWLGERIGRARWIAITVGFAGMLVGLAILSTAFFFVAGLAILATVNEPRGKAAAVRPSM